MHFFKASTSSEIILLISRILKHVLYSQITYWWNWPILNQIFVWTNKINYFNEVLYRITIISEFRRWFRSITTTNDCRKWFYKNDSEKLFRKMILKNDFKKKISENDYERWFRWFNKNDSKKWAFFHDDFSSRANVTFSKIDYVTFDTPMNLKTE